MGTILVVPILLLSCVEKAYCQPDTLWTLFIPGRGSQSKMEAVQTADGGFAFCSSGWNGQQDHQNTDFYLCKLDSGGEIEWDALYASTIEGGRASDYANCLGKELDDGFVLGGFAGPHGMVVRTDSVGNQEWTKYLLYEEGYETIYGMVVADNGNILVGSGERMVMLSDSAEGEVLWHRNFIDGDFTEWANLLNIGGGELLLGGATADTGSGGFDMCVAKINQDGDLLWLHLYGRELSEVCGGIASSPDGGWFLAGTYFFSGELDSSFGIVFKIDSEGEEEWRQVYDQYVGYDQYAGGDRFLEAVPTPDGGLAICGYNHSDYDYLLIRLDAEGEVLWRTTFIREGINVCTHLLALEDGGYLLTGYTSGDAWLIRTEPDPANQIELEALSQDYDFGDVLIDSASVWQLRVRNSGHRYAILDSISIEEESGVFVSSLRYAVRINTGDTTTSTVTFRPIAESLYTAVLHVWYGGESLEVMLSGRGVKPGGVSREMVDLPASFAVFSFPDPFNSTARIQYALPGAAGVSLSIYDILGNEIIRLVEGKQTEGYHSVNWNGVAAGGIPVTSGIYFIRLKAGKQSLYRKMTLIK